MPARRAAWIDALVVLALSLGYLSLLPHCFSTFDEGTVADTSERILRGEVLYRDFFSYWNPGGFWLNAILFKIADTSVQTLRIPLALFGAVTAVGVWRLARDHCGRLLAILAGVAVTLVCYPVWWMASSHWYSTFTAIAAAVMLRRCFEERPRPWVLFGTGTLCGLTFMMLQPVGGFLSIAIFAVLAWDGLFLSSRTETLKRVTVFSVGVLAPIILMYGYYAAQGALGIMMYDTLLWNLEHYSPSLKSGYGAAGTFERPNLGYDTIRWVLMVLPPVTYVLALAVSGTRYVRRTTGLGERRLFALAAIGTSLLASNYYFPDVIHLAFGAAPAFALLSALLSRWGDVKTGRYAFRVAAVCFAIFSVFAGYFSAQTYRARCPIEIPTPRGTIAAPLAFQEGYRELFAFSEERLAPDEHFYVYPYGAGYNFLVGSPSAVPFPIVFPTVPNLTSEEELAAVVSALARDEFRFVLVPFLFRATFTSADTQLERFIRSHFKPVGEGGILILERHTGGSAPRTKAP